MLDLTADGYWSYVKPRGGTPQRIMNAQASGPRFSPDGRKVTFASDRTGNWDVFTMAPDGTNQRNVSAHSATDGGPDWASDGENLWFHSDRTGPWQIWLMRFDGTDPRAVMTSTFGHSVPRLSPLNLWLAYEARDGANHSRDFIRVAALDGTNIRDIAGPFENSWATDWSPDGARVVFHATRNGSEDVGLVNRDGSGLKFIGASGTTETEPSWQPASRLPNRYPSVAVSPRLVGTAAGHATVTLTATATDLDLGVDERDRIAYAWSSVPALTFTTPGAERPSVTLASSDAS
ncbi:MAG: PD40 domain-containing protein, partial [Candidatus Riflebacteria bacterium]|nr:PD40 domain-containing protein [Candidatus Riflebacteria bacterium]